MRCNICGFSKLKRVHDFQFIKLFKCLSCGVVFSGENKYPEKIQDWGKEYEDIDNYFISHSEKRDNLFIEILDNQNIKPPGKVLDVGCGMGGFLHKARSRGWRTAGVEPSESLCAYAKKHYNLTIINAEFKKSLFKDKEFDLITLFDVLEHIPDPKKFISDLGKILAPGGHLAIAGPNFSSLTSKMCILSYYLTFGKFQEPVKMLTQVEYKHHHTYYFTMKSLLYLTKNPGLKPVYKNTISSILADEIFKRKQFQNYPKAILSIMSKSLGAIQYVEKQASLLDTLLVVFLKNSL